MSAHVRRPESAGMPYRVTEGDDLLQDYLFADETIRRGLNMLNQYASDDLAFTPEVVERFKEILQRRYDTNEGMDRFEMPNYGIYEDPEMAAFYGCDTSRIDNIQTRKETYDEIIDRLLRETVRELEPELKGLSDMMNLYAVEDWARYGVAAEKPFVHSNPDITLFRNPTGTWSAIDIAASTSDKRNVIDMYEAHPQFTYSTPHEGWLVDRRGGFWDKLDPGGPPPLGFY